MVARLQGRNGIDAIRVISHGSQGALYLGSTLLDSEGIASNCVQLATIGNSLTDTGDILLYGCSRKKLRDASDDFDLMFEVETV